MTGCTVCGRYQQGTLHGPAIILGPRRVHERAVRALGENLARQIVQDRTDLWPVARELLQTAGCAVGRMREWPPIVTPTGPGPGA